jgi:hypothetical protein
MTKKQIDKFKDAAKEVGADMPEAEFQKVVSTLAKSGLPKKQAKKPKK